MSRRMEALLAKGDDIGSWSGKTIYSVDRLYEQAESLRVLAYQKYHANTQTSLQEAFVLLMRFAKFYDLISAQKAVKRDSAAHTKLKRDLLGAITTLEELKPRLLKMFGEAEPAPLQAEPEEEGRDELELRMQEQLEARWANLAPKPKPPPPKLEPPKPAPPKPEPAAAAAPTGGGAAAAAAGAVAGATAGMAAASLLPNGAPPPPPYDGVGGSMGGVGGGGGGGAGANGSASLASAASAPSISPPSVAPPPVTPPALAPTGQPPPQPPPPQPPQPLQPPQPPQPLQPPQPPASAAATPVGPGAAAPATGVAAPPVIPLPPKPPPSAPPAGGAASAADSGAAASGPAPAAGAAAGAAARAGADPPPSYAKYANTNYPTIARPIEKLPTGTGSGKEGEAGAPREGSGVADVGMRHRLSSGGAESASVEALRQRVKARQLSLSGKKEAQDPRSRLSRHLKLRGFTIKDVPGDNNCQFHALADQLQQVGISGWTATKVRRAAVQWLDENGKRPMDDGKVGQRTLLKDSVGVENWGQYINEMSQHGITWGDEATLLAASVLFKAEIVVISSLSEDYCHIVTPPDVWKVELNTRLYLGHYHEFHYVSTRPTGD